MTNYWEERKKVISFLSENKMDTYSMLKILKDLCCCRSCKFFIQHYAKDGTPVDFGHCVKNNLPKSKKPSTASCGFWEDGEDE